METKKIDLNAPLEDWLVQNGYKKNFHDWYTNKDLDRIKVAVHDGMATVVQFKTINADTPKQLQQAIKDLTT
jgi:hypothetical protein